MSSVNKCDRCGFVCEPYQTATVIVKYNKRGILDAYPVGYTYDLCPQCRVDLERFLEGKNKDE